MKSNVQVCVQCALQTKRMQIAMINCTVHTKQYLNRLSAFVHQTLTKAYLRTHRHTILTHNEWPKKTIYMHKLNRMQCNATRFRCVSSNFSVYFWNFTKKVGQRRIHRRNKAPVLHFNKIYSLSHVQAFCITITMLISRETALFVRRRCVATNTDTNVENAI